MRLAILSQAAPNIFEAFTQFGCLGLVVLGFLTGWIYSRASMDRVLKENDRLNVELARHNQMASEVIIPVLVSSKDLIIRMETKLGAGK